MVHNSEYDRSCYVFHMHLKRMYILCCCVTEFSINLKLITYVDSDVQVFYSFINFIYFSQLLRGAEISSHNSGFVYSSFQFHQFLLHVLWSHVMKCVNILNCYTPLNDFLLWNDLHARCSLLWNLLCLIWSHSRFSSD